MSTDVELANLMTEMGHRLSDVLDRRMDEKLARHVPRRPLPTGEWLSVMDVARHLDIAPSVVRERCRKGELQAVKLGNPDCRANGWRIHRSSVPGLAPSTEYP